MRIEPKGSRRIGGCDGQNWGRQGVEGKRGTVTANEEVLSAGGTPLIPGGGVGHQWRTSIYKVRDQQVKIRVVPQLCGETD